jgi:hypothetical protein
MFQEEGVRNFTPLTNSTKGPNKCTNNNLWTFQQISLPEGIKFSQKTKFGQEVGNFFLWNEHPLQCCVTPSICRIYESNLRILNLLQTPIIPWIIHKFVKTLQPRCVQIGNQKNTKLDSQIWTNHFFWWLGQHCMASIVECNTYLSKWQCIHRFYWHNLRVEGCPLHR